jgi:hypothetical protein
VRFVRMTEGSGSGSTRHDRYGQRSGKSGYTYEMAPWTRKMAAECTTQNWTSHLVRYAPNRHIVVTLQHWEPAFREDKKQIVREGVYGDGEVGMGNTWLHHRMHETALRDQDDMRHQHSVRHQCVCLEVSVGAQIRNWNVDGYAVVANCNGFLGEGEGEEQRIEASVSASLDGNTKSLAQHHFDDNALALASRGEVWEGWNSESGMEHICDC